MHLKEEIAKKMTQMKKKKVLFNQDNVPYCKSIATMVKLQELCFELYLHPLFSRCNSQWLLAVCRPQKNVSGKEIWLQWRSDIGNWGVFWGQRQIILQKRYWMIRETLESMCHARRRLLMNKVKFCLKVVILLIRPRTYWVMCYFGCWLLIVQIFTLCSRMMMVEHSVSYDEGFFWSGRINDNLLSVHIFISLMSILHFTFCVHQGVVQWMKKLCTFIIHMCTVRHLKTK